MKQSNLVPRIFLLISAIVCAQNPQCNADFVTSLINADQNEIVTFSQTSNGADNFQWLFAPNALPISSTQENPQVTFNQLGSTNVDLSISSNSGCTDTIIGAGPNIVDPSQTIEECWTIINNGVDIYNGQLPLPQWPGHWDIELVDLKEVQGGFLTCGYYNDQIFGSQYGIPYSDLQNKKGSYLSKHNKDGLLKWIVHTEKEIFSDRDIMISSIEDQQGNIYVSGNSLGVFYDNFGNQIDMSHNFNVAEGFIVKLDSSGKILWHLKGVNLFSKKLFIDNNNDLIVIGDLATSISSQTQYDLYLNNQLTNTLNNLTSTSSNRFILKLNAQGNLIWYTGLQTNGPNTQLLDDLSIDANNNLYVIGHCSRFLNYYSANSLLASTLSFPLDVNPRMFMIKFDQNGQVIWDIKSQIVTATGYSRVLPTSITTDSLGNSYITGNSFGALTSTENHVFDNADGTTTSESVGGFFLAKVNPNGICEWIRGAAHSYYGYGYKVIKSGDEIIAIGAVKDRVLPSVAVEFLSTSGNNLQMTFYPSDFFLTVYDSQGNLKRIVTNGINNSNMLVGDRISGFFKDSQSNYYMSRNVRFFNNVSQDYQLFGHNISPTDFNQRDGTITKFTEDCGIVTYAGVSQNLSDLILCDNESVGTDDDGLVQLDLTQIENEILNGQLSSNYQISYFSDVGLLNQINSPTAYQNSNTSETIYVDVIDVSNPNFMGLTSFNIQIVSLPIVNSPVQLTQCDDDTDGITVFNLNEVVDEITLSSSSNTTTFYLNQNDAENSVNVITSLTNYQNSTPNAQTLYARVENNEGCYRVARVDLQVTTSQIPSSFSRTLYQCDDGTDLYDGVATFDMTSAQSDINGLFPAGQMISISYYRTELEALTELNEISNIASYENIGFVNTQDIYVRVENANNNDCIGLGPFVRLVVESNPIATGPIIVEQCDINNDGTESIDTSNINTQLLQGQTGVDLIFRDATGTTLPNPLPNPLTTATQSITVEMSNSNSLDPDGVCTVLTSIDITIDAGVVANPVTTFDVCDDDNDGFFSFDTSTIQSDILGNQTGVTVTYEDQNGNLLPSPLPNPFVSDTQTITATVINPTNSFCFEQTNIDFIVNSVPVANAIMDDIICDDISNDGQHLFDLTTYNNQVLNGQSLTTYSISYHSSQNDADSGINALPSSYLSTSVSETIYARIESGNNASCYDTTSFKIGVSRLPIANTAADIEVCDDSSNDGIEIFNLSSQNMAILNGQSATDNIITFHSNQLDAEQGVSPLPSNYTNTTSPETIYARIENRENSDCYAVTFFDLIIYEQPVLLMKDEWTICENDSVEIVADSGYDNYLWSTSETTESIIVTMPGTYDVTVSNNYGTIICDDTKSITVIESTVAVITNIEIEDWSQDNNSVYVEVQGTGDYEYSLDGITYQESNRFDNLPIGDYQIYVRDRNGCGITEQDIYLLFYPRFFTPNGDNYHDFWQLYNSEREPDNKIFIYNRYGKLLKQLNPTGIGWDGTYNGNPMPSSDYWFVVERGNGKTYKGHFTLKR